MARNLLNRGHAVTVWARRPEAMAPLVTAGAAASESAAQIANANDVIITMVTDTEAVDDVILGEHGVVRGVRPGSLVIDHSTIDPGGARRIADGSRCRDARRAGVRRQRSRGSWYARHHGRRIEGSSRPGPPPALELRSAHRSGGREDHVRRAVRPWGAQLEGDLAGRQYREAGLCQRRS